MLDKHASFLELIVQYAIRATRFVKRVLKAATYKKWRLVDRWGEVETETDSRDCSIVASSKRKESPVFRGRVGTVHAIAE